LVSLAVNPKFFRSARHSAELDSPGFMSGKLGRDRTLGKSCIVREQMNLRRFA